MYTRSRPVRSGGIVSHFLRRRPATERRTVFSIRIETLYNPHVQQRGRILGIGGIFFKSANRDQMREWYSKHLGLADKGEGVTLPWRDHDDPQKEHVTVWTVFPTSTDYFDPSRAPFMVNYIVDDLDALLDRLEQEGVKIDAKRMNESYGRFAWIYDLDGNKIELWQPPPAKP